MKQIVGCGPFVFDYYDRSLAAGRVVRYDDFFVNAPVLGGVVGEWRVDPDTNYTYSVLVQNMAAKNNTAEGELRPVTVDVKIYEDDELKHTQTSITLDPWKFIYLDPYTTDALSKGLHTVKVEVYEGENLIHTYNHKIAITLREDLTTYYGDPIDFKVDGRDLIIAARAFGSYPGQLRWHPPADVNDDFKVDGTDLIKIARKFGWG